MGCVRVRREESPLLQAAKTDSERFPGMCAAAVEGGGIDPGLPGRGPGRRRSRGAVLCRERNDTFAEPSRQRLPWRARRGAERQRAAAAGAELGLGGGRNGPAAPGHRGAAPHPAEDGSSSMRAVKPKQEAISQPCLSSSEDDSPRDPDASPCSGTRCPYPCSWAPIPSGCHQARGLTNYRQSASSAGKGSFLPRPYTRGLFSSSSVSESAAGGSVSDAGPRDARVSVVSGQWDRLQGEDSTSRPKPWSGPRWRKARGPLLLPSAVAL